jgi:ABC-type multidrug transport system permease subunit
LLTKYSSLAFLTLLILWNVRFFKQYLLLLALNQMAASLFRFVGGAARNMIVANVFGSFMLLIFMVLGGFILVRGTTSPFSKKRKKKRKE